MISKKLSKCFLILIFLTFIIICLPTVFAVDLDGGNFTSLNETIDPDNSDSVEIDLNGDVQLNNDSSSEEDNFLNGIIINKTVVIDGLNSNGDYSIIDASSDYDRVKVFNVVNGGNLTLKNLIIANGNSTAGGAISIKEGGIVNLVNVTFIDNNGVYGGTICLSNGTLNGINLKFLNSQANYGGSIYSSLARVNLINSTFIDSSSVKSAGGAILISDSTVYLDEIIFNNCSSITSGGAITSKSSKLFVTNCDFVNNNCTSSGSAIFSEKSDVTVDGSGFENNTGGFGTLCFLSGELIINNSDFTNNYVLYNGGAVYSSFASTIVTNVSFNNNKASKGGSIYLDYSLNNTVIDDCIFTDNEGIIASGIFANENNILIKDSIFTNNDVYTQFDKNTRFENSTFVNSPVSLNNTYYFNLVNSSAEPLILVNNTLNITVLPSKLDLRDYGLVTSVKNQGMNGACWSFGALAALESALLKSTNQTYDLSENNMQDLMIKYSQLGNALFDAEGDFILSVAYLTSWLGTFSSDFDIYDDFGKLSPVLNSSIHVQDVIKLPDRKNATDLDLIKKSLIDYGAMVFAYYHDNNYLNGSSYYYNGDKDTNHIVCVVGWDDNYSKYNFKDTPQGDGAFIIKNSWGTDNGDNGYYYISYYDTMASVLGTFLINNTLNYNKNYQYDMIFSPGHPSNSSSIWYANQYTSVGDDFIAAVGTYFVGTNVLTYKEYNYELSVYVNGEFKYSQNGTSTSYYNTIQLNTLIPVETGDVFKVVVKLTSFEGNAYLPLMLTNFNGSLITRLHLLPNQSFYSEDGNEWEDLYDNNYTACIKVYTLENIANLTTDDLVMDYKDGSKFTANLTNSNIPISNVNVTFKVNGVLYNRTTDNNGIAKLNINLAPGTYNITSSYGNMTYTNLIVINSWNISNVSIESNNFTKAYKNGTQYELTLKYNNKAVSGVNVFITVNGVTYTRITNNNGTAKLNINLQEGNYSVSSNVNIAGVNKTSENTVSVISANTKLVDNNVSTINCHDYYVVNLIGTTSNDYPLSNQGTIIIKVNGVNYMRTSDINGQAKLQLNLKPGTYIITTSFIGNNNCNSAETLVSNVTIV